MNTITREHIALGRRVIRARQSTLADMAEKWELDPDAFWAALAAEREGVADPPLTPSEALAADPRNAQLALAGEREIAPTRRGERLLCGVPGCGRAHRARGYCMAHFKRLSRDGDPQVDTPIAAAQRPTGRACATPGCPNEVLTRRPTVLLEEAKDYCAPCYRNYRDRKRREDARKRQVVFA